MSTEDISLHVQHVILTDFVHMGNEKRGVALAADPRYAFMVEYEVFVRNAKVGLFAFMEKLELVAVSVGVGHDVFMIEYEVSVFHAEDHPCVFMNAEEVYVCHAKEFRFANTIFNEEVAAFVADLHYIVHTTSFAIIARYAEDRGFVLLPCVKLAHEASTNPIASGVSSL